MKKNKIAITTGDPLGIGEEITKKALEIVKPDKNQILIIGADLGLGYETIDLDFDRKRINRTASEKNKTKTSVGKYCYDCLALASSLANKNEIRGILTAPVSKNELNKAGYNFSGQTEVLEKLLTEKNTSKTVQNPRHPTSLMPPEKAEMLFIAGDLRVLLLTRHIPLNKIKITEKMIIEKTQRLNNFLIEKEKIASPKIAFCALNPHAGENGMLGMEEIEIINPAIKKLNEIGINSFGAFSADGLFGKIGKKYTRGEKQEFDAIVAMYHDQALCPIKTLCFDKAVNTTIGLKILRTSPSSGTAYDIAGKNIADPTSMVEALKLLLKLV